MCVPVYGRFELAIPALRAIDRHTPEDVTILVIDDGSPEPLAEAVPADLAASPRIDWVRNQPNIGYLGSANLALRYQSGADVVLVNSDVLVGPGWFLRLQSAAYASARVATASAMTDLGAILTVEVDGVGIDASDPDVLVRINDELGRLPTMAAPQIPVAVGHCLYIRADAIEAVGVFDDAFGLGYEEEVDFSLRASAVGLIHVVAPDVVVHHEGGASFGERAERLRAAGHKLLLNRYPDYEKMVRAFMAGAEGLRAAFLRVRIAERGGLRVLIWATGEPSPDGSGGLWDLAEHLHGESTVVTVVSTAQPPFELQEVDRLAVADLRDRTDRDGKFECVIALGVPPDAASLSHLWAWGHRVLILQRDFLDYSLPMRHASRAAYAKYRSAVVAAAMTADAFVTSSDDSLRQAKTAGISIEQNNLVPPNELLTRLWEICSSPPRVPIDVRRRVQMAGMLRSERLRQVRQSQLGFALMPPGSSRAAVGKALARVLQLR